MNLFSLVNQFNADASVNKNLHNDSNIIIINNDDNINNNNNNNNIICNEKIIISDHAVISKETGTESGIVMVTFNSTSSPSLLSSSSSSSSSTLRTSSKSSLFTSSTLQMKLKIKGDRLILLREEGDSSEDVALIIGDKVLQTNLLDSNLGDRPANIEEYRTVKLVREKSIGFGLSIKGGCEHGLPILISGLIKDGPADRSRQLFIGDAIVRIDNTTLSLTTTTHEEAIRLLKQANVEVNLTVKHFKMVSPFLTKCWRKKQTLDEDDAGSLMVTTVCTTNNNGLKQEKGKQLLKTVERQCALTANRSLRDKIQTSSSSSSNGNHYDKKNGTNGDSNNVKQKGKVKKSVIHSPLERCNSEQTDTSKWLPLVEIDLVTCFVTKYVHDSDKIRPYGFEIRWLTKVLDDHLRLSSATGSSYPSTPSSSTSSSSTTSSTSSTSSTTSLSTPKSIDCGVNNTIGLKYVPKSTTSSNENFKKPESGIVTGTSTKIYSSAIVICNNQQIYREWFTNIDKSVKSLTCARIKTLNQHLPRSERILFMGWINQGLPSTSSEPHRPCYYWHTRYLVIKGGDALIYTKPPQGLLLCSNDTSPPSNTTTSPLSSTIRWSEGQPYLFKAHQSVLSCLKPSEYVDERENCFLLLSDDTNYSSSLSSSVTPTTKSPKTSVNEKTKNDDNHHSHGKTIKSDPMNSLIINKPPNETATTAVPSPTTTTTTKSSTTSVCYLSVETTSELALIRNNWNRATYQSVTQLGAKTFVVTCCGKRGSLTLDWRFGFTFTYPNEHKYNWSYKFSQLKTSSDDGRTTLWLSFRIPLHVHNPTTATAAAATTASSSFTSSTFSFSSPSSSSTSSSSSRLEMINADPRHSRRFKLTNANGQSEETLLNSSTSSIITSTPDAAVASVANAAVNDVNVNPSGANNSQKYLGSTSSASSSSTSTSSSAGSLLSSSTGNQRSLESTNNANCWKQFTIETREIVTDQLQDLLYSMHAFLTAKVISVDQSFLNSCSY